MAKDALAVLAELLRALDSENDERIERAWVSARETVDAHREVETDPRTIPGSIAGPGGAFDKGAVVFDGRFAVLHDRTEIAQMDEAPVQPAFGLVMEGRINKTTDRASVLFYCPLDSLAATITQMHGVAERAGVLDELHALCAARWEEMPHG